MFLFTLARSLGKTVSELLSQLDAPEIGEWRAYFRILQTEDMMTELKNKSINGIVRSKAKRRG